NDHAVFKAATGAVQQHGFHCYVVCNKLSKLFAIAFFYGAPYVDERIIAVLELVNADVRRMRSRHRSTKGKQPSSDCLQHCSYPRVLGLLISAVCPTPESLVPLLGHLLPRAGFAARRQTFVRRDHKCGVGLQSSGADKWASRYRIKAWRHSGDFGSRYPPWS